MVLRKLFTIDSNINGRGPVLFQWSKDGSVMAVAGTNRRVVIVDRQGKTMHQISLPGPGAVVGLEWDCLGEVLAVMQQNSPIIVLWNVVLNKQDQIETGLKDLTFMKWSKVGPQLAIGTAKGVLMMYNRKTMKKNTIMGKHTKKITCGTWNTQNRLAMGGEDKQITISDPEGGDIESVSVKLEPTTLVFADMKGDERTKVKESTVSCNLQGKTLLLYNVQGQEPPVELSFQQRYGAITGYRWFGDGYILIGFANGFVIVVSTHLKEIGQEVASARFHRDNLSDVTYCPSVMKGASVGDNCVRVYDMDELSKMSEQRSEKYEFDNEYGNLTRVDWTDDGQILTVSSKNGNVYTFLTRIPVLSDACANRLVYLVSLRELNIRDVSLEADVGHIPIEIEPSFVSLGPGTVALGMNNHVWYYRFTTSDSRSTSSEDVRNVSTRVFATTVDVVKVNAKYAAVLMDGKVFLHLIDQREDDNLQNVTDRRLLPRNFPEKESAQITAIAMTPSFLILGTQAGNISVFSLDEFEMVTEYRTSAQVGIRSLFPNLSGTRVAFIDNNNNGYVFRPANDQVVSIENFHSGTERILWDFSDPNVMVGVQKTELVTYLFAPYTRFGTTCTPVCLRDNDGALTPTPNTTVRPFGFNCIMLYQGNVVSQIQSGSLATTALNTHSSVSFNSRYEVSTEAFYNNLALDHLDLAQKCACNGEHKVMVAQRALQTLDIEMAYRLYQDIGNVQMTAALESIRHITEKYQLLGFVAMISKNFSEAQTNFIRSSNPKLALEMRRNLLHWDQALSLAETMAPGEVPLLSKEYAQQLEFRGEFVTALEMYRKGRVRVADNPGEDETSAALRERQTLISNNEACDAGEARMLLRTGAIAAGVKAALATGNRSLCNECASILEQMKQWDDAATLYEKAEQYEKAARIHIREMKNLRAAQRLLPKVRAKGIIIMYAKARETEGSYQDAEQAYTQAEDWDNVVRLKVEYLNDIHNAHTIVRRTKSNDAAALVARSCVKLGEYKAAIEFLLMAKKTNEAMEIAKKHNEMKTLGETLVEHSKTLPPGTVINFHEEYVAIATWYEGINDHESAGDFYTLALQYPKALTKYLQVGTDAALQKGISVVAQAKNETLTHRMFEFLMGEPDGKPKDLNYIFRLYLALQAFDKAARTAVILSKQEQELGNYRVAHKMLFETFVTLRKNNIRILGELRRTLMLQHSYIIVKSLAKIKDHEGAARMLIRVARNIQKFPKHIVPILTSTVVECLKVEFKASAYEYATVLVQPQHRPHIPEKHRKTIENTVRKKGKEELIDPPEHTSPCPYCDTQVPDTILDCHNCKNTIPFCIVTGKHMVVEDWSMCPRCDFPALFKPFIRLLEEEPKCPMCEETVQVQDVLRKDKSSKIVPFQDDDKDVGAPTPMKQAPPAKYDNEGAGVGS